MTKVQLWECNTAGGQQWRRQANGSLLNPQSGRCLDAPQGATANGTRLQIYDCNGLDPQKWTVPQ
ncbi:MAG TPA: ricin-type beta-trefoil lectin domain protein [Nonomuraea sp.]|nr:ricin-type beta-trefoil lectin domain protein [Nonomuraea sp.]